MKRINKTEEYMLYYEQFLALQEQGRLKEGSVYHILDLPDGLDLVEGKWTVKKAEQDAEGNIIHETYVKRLDLDYKIVDTLPVDTSMGKMIYLDSQIEPVIYNTADMVQVEDTNVTMNASSQEFWDSITNGVYVDGLAYYTETDEESGRRFYEVYLYVTNVDNLGEYESVDLKLKTNLWERDLNLSFVGKENNVISYALVEEGSESQGELTFLVDNNVLFTRLLLITDQIDLAEYFQLENVISNTGDILYINSGRSEFNLLNLKIANGNEYTSFVPTKISDLENDIHFATEEYVEQNGGKIDSISLNDNELEIVDKKVNIEINKDDVGLSNVDNTSDMNKPVSTAQANAIDAVQSNLDEHLSDYENPHNVNKTQIGLSNVDNTSDLDKPMSNETKEAFDSLAATLSNTILPRLDNVDEDITNINNDITNNIKPRITSIEEKIPNQASATNQLADKDFVNSSINSSVAFFKGNFATKADLDAVQWQTTDDTLTTFVSNNDYAYVESDETHDNEAWRYIYVLDEASSGWQPQFRVNETPFTSVQLAAINSNITAEIVNNTKTHLLSTENPHQVTKAQVGLGNVDNTADLDKPISNAVSAEFAKYLPLTAGEGKKITGTLYATSNGIVLGTETIQIPNQKGILFGSLESKTGLSGNASGDIGLFAGNNLYLRTDLKTDAESGIQLTRTVFKPFKSGLISLGTDANRFVEIHGETLYQNGKQVANAENLSAVTDATLSSDSKTLTVTKRDGTSFDFQGGSDLSEYVPITRTINGKALSSNISLNSKDVGALPDYTLTINHGTAGNPRMVKFVSVNYTSRATCFKMAAMTCHDNGVSYQFLTDMLIAVTTAGEVTANIYKFAQSDVGNVDGVTRYTGDVFYVNDTTNKIVDFYILCGQYSSSQFTPVTKVGSTTIDNVTQYSGNATYYSSGTKTWVNGCGTTYARLSDLDNRLALDGSNTMTGKLNLKLYGSNEGNIGPNGIAWDTTSLPQDTAPQFVCTIDGFASGGRQKWASIDDLRTALGTSGGGLNLTNWEITEDSNGNLTFGLK